MAPIELLLAIFEDTVDEMLLLCSAVVFLNAITRDVHLLTGPDVFAGRAVTIAHAYARTTPSSVIGPKRAVSRSRSAAIPRSPSRT